MAHLLVVDDEDYAVEGIKAALDWPQLGITGISTAFNGAQARDQFLVQVPDLVLCDIEMPRENGLEFLAWVKLFHPHVEVILLTAHADFALAQKAVRLQGFDYLVKPVTPEELAGVVTRALNTIAGAAEPREPTPPAESVEEAGPADQIRLPDMGPWIPLLKSGRKEQVRAEFRNHLDRIRNELRNRNVPSLWFRLLLDVQQVISAVLRSRSVSAHELLAAPGASELFHKATESAVDLLRWVDYSLDFATGRLASLQRDETPVGQAVRFINLHLEENVTCEQVAAHVSMNPDYLTRLFKKDVGQSVSAYISLAKLKFAADLLTGTTLPIGEIAARIGYDNPAHFSTAFKKAMNRKPSEYRTERTPAAPVQAGRNRVVKRSAHG